jgi:hypothetical protein
MTVTDVLAGRFWAVSGDASSVAPRLQIPADFVEEMLTESDFTTIT